MAPLDAAVVNVTAVGSLDTAVHWQNEYDAVIAKTSETPSSGSFSEVGVRVNVHVFAET